MHLADNTLNSCSPSLVCIWLVYCALCFTLIRFLIRTDVSSRNCTPSVKCLIYVLCEDMNYASVRVIFFDVASYGFETRYASTINNYQRSIPKCERGFVSVNKAYEIVFSEWNKILARQDTNANYVISGFQILLCH